MIKRNLIANYAGQIWVALMGMVFLPFYIKLIGIESFGLIGLYGVLSAWFVLLDLGISAGLSREIALFTGGANSPNAIRQLLRSVEFVSFIIATFIFISTCYASNWLASSWLKASEIPIETVELAFQVMGFVAALRFIEGVYRSCVLGLQLHVLYNVVNSVLATIRGVGAIGVLIYVSPTIYSFFLWQAAISIFTTAILGLITYWALPPTEDSVKLSIRPLLKIWKFAGGMFSITLLSLLLTQADKIILSSLVSLGEYGHYTLAAMVSGMLYMLITPITQTWYPKFVQFYAANQQAELVINFHLAAQMVVVVSAVCALTGALFAGELIFLWTGDIDLAKSVSPILSILFIGNLLNTLMYIPYQIQLAHGVTKIAVYGNLIAVIIIIPAVYMLVPVYGSISAAGIWVFLNAAYVVFGASYMFRKILHTEKYNWYWYDVLIPIVVCLVPLLIGRHIMNNVNPEKLYIWLIIIVSGLSSMIFAFFLTVQLRTSVYAAIKNWIATRRLAAGNI